MKILNNLFKTAYIACCILCLQSDLLAQEDSVKQIIRKPFLSLNYHNVQNQIQTITFKGFIKSKNKLEPISSRNVKIYFNEAGEAENLIGEVKTDFSGKAVFTIPPKFNEIWKASNTQTIVGVMDPFDEFENLEAEIEITKSKMLVDTLTEDDQKKIVIKFYEQSDTSWLPVTDVEMKVGVKRLGSILPIGEEVTFTTDSTGTIIADYMLDSIPGNEAGEIILIAKIEEHEMYGTVENEISVPWGNAFQTHFKLDHRSLWATGDKVPIWLLFLAITIISSVWGTMIYILFQLFKIIKLGKA
ncbi:MAG: hypothetical protein IPM92_02035 [Saprospiraceae bacterium]|nr:hypothetical protein [Saprospiraceae bacterium]